jgi:hypothetical protein
MMLLWISSVPPAIEVAAPIAGQQCIRPKQGKRMLARPAVQKAVAAEGTQLP